MSDLRHLLENNRAWAAQIKDQDPTFFRRLSRQQSPEYLWIGCSDSRVPATQLVNVQPGEMFVHRNVANVVVHSDLNCLSVLQYAVEVLKVRHVIVCGHYGCGGVEAALARHQLGLTDNWLRHVQDVLQKYRDLIFDLDDAAKRLRRLCELNVIEQVVNVCQTAIVDGAWGSGQELTVHGWVYGLEDGLLRDLNISTSGPDEVPERYRAAVAAV